MKVARSAAAALAASGEPQVRTTGTLSFDTSGYLYVDCPGCTGVTGFADDSAFTVGTTPITVVGGYYTTGSAPSVTSGSAGRLRIDSNSYLEVDCVTGCSGGGAAAPIARAIAATAPDRDLQRKWLNPVEGVVVGGGQADLFAHRAGAAGEPTKRHFVARIPAGSVVALIGSNGAGKTTVARTITGLVPATSGVISLGPLDVTRLPSYRIARLGVAHAVEGRGVFATLTVEENLVLAFRQRGGCAH